MSYNKLGFTSGQKLKAEHLNHMEEGIANAVPNACRITLTADNYGYINYKSTYLDNYDEIYDILAACGTVWLDRAYMLGLNPGEYVDLITNYRLDSDGLHLVYDLVNFEEILCPNGSHNLPVPDAS